MASVGLLVIIAVPNLKAIWYTNEFPEDAAHQLKNWYPDALEADIEDEVLVVNVFGYQWWWAFDYPQLGITTANEMIMPAGKVVELKLRSKDVIHSFWLPRIAGKVDLIPGRANEMWVQAGDTFEVWKVKNGLNGDDASLIAAFLICMARFQL